MKVSSVSLPPFCHVRFDHRIEREKPHDGKDAFRGKWLGRAAEWRG